MNMLSKYTFHTISTLINMNLVKWYNNYTVYIVYQKNKYNVSRNGPRGVKVFTRKSAY
jgi:hypothetical protein